MSQNTGSANTDIVALLGGQTLDGAAAIDGIVNRALTVSAGAFGTGADTNETTLWSYTLPANTLSANGKGIRLTFAGSVGANGNTKTFRVKWAGSAITTDSTTASGNAFKYVVEVFRSAAGAQVYSLVLFRGAAIDRNTCSTLSTDETSTIALSFTGQNGTGNANDIVLRFAAVETLY